MDAVVDVAVTQEPITQEMQVDQEEDTITQEPVSLKAMNAAAEENIGDVVVTQEPATLIVNLDMLEDTTPQEPVLLHLKDFIDLNLEQEKHYKKEILDLTIEASTLRLEVTKWKS